MKRYLFLLALPLACGEAKRRSPHPPLLGVRSEKMIAQFQASCDPAFALVGARDKEPSARLTRSRYKDLQETYICEMSNRTTYELTFNLGQVGLIAIRAPTVRDRVAVFERVFARLVPQDLGAPMLGSIADGQQFDARPDAHVIVHSGDEASINWTVGF